MRRLLSVIFLYLSTCSPGYAGYASVVLPQISQYIQSYDADGNLRNWPNPTAHMQPVGMFCKPVDFAQHSDDPAKRTVVVRSEAGTLTDAQVLAICPKELDEKYNRLWQQAHAIEEKNISGVGLSILALGNALGKPKAKACAAWSDTLWGIYYQCKALVTLDSDPDCDFTAAGDMPYTVPDLAAEVR